MKEAFRDLRTLTVVLFAFALLYLLGMGLLVLATTLLGHAR